MNNLWWLFLLIGIVVEIILCIVTYYITILILKNKKIKQESKCICPSCKIMYVDFNYNYCPHCGGGLMSAVEYASIDIVDNVNVYNLSINKDVYDELCSGNRTFGFVEYHQDYKIGDHIRFLIKNDDDLGYTQSDLIFVITSIVKDIPELKDGCCCLGLKLRIHKGVSKDE